MFRNGDLCGDLVFMEIVQENKDDDSDNILIEISQVIRVNLYIFEYCKKIIMVERKDYWMKNQEIG